MKNKIILEYYSIDALLKLLYENNIEATSLIFLDEYHLSLCVNNFDLKKIKKLKIKIILEKPSFTRRIISFFCNEKVLVFSLLISLFYFINLKRKIANVFIKGPSIELNENIKNSLKKDGIYKDSPMKNVDELSLLQKKYLILYQEEITTFSLNLKGNNIYVNYVMKPKTINIESLHGKMFSKYNAVVSLIKISSGNVLVKTNQYVTKGQLIVDDEITVNDQVKYLGTKGKIYGYVYFEITKTCPIYSSKVDAFENNLLDARYEVLKNLEEDEKLIEEKILVSRFEKEIHTLKISFLTIKNLICY